MLTEELDTSNLTGGQIQEALDFLIYRALEPIVRHSTIFDVQLVHLLGIAATNKKRKISALDREVFLTKLCNALSTTNVERKLEYVSGAKIERSFVLNFLANFLEQTKDYIPLYTDYLTCSSFRERDLLNKKLAAMERNVGFSRDHLFPALGVCRRYVDLSYAFRNKIVEQYLKHGYKQAHAFCKAKGQNFDRKDVFQSLMAAVTKAIDKYDSSKGALTSYVNYWVLNAQTYPSASSNYGHEYGIAYSMPQLQKKQLQGKKSAQVNFSVSLDATTSGEDGSALLVDSIKGCDGVDKKYEQQCEADTILYLIKSADIRGLARLYLDLDEFISVREQRRMVKAMKKELGFIPPEVDPAILQTVKAKSH